MSDVSRVDINRQIQVLRHNLLDLTMRNQLLNFRPRTRTVEITGVAPEDVYERLILKKSKRYNQLQFLPKSENEILDEENGEPLEEEAEAILWDAPAPDIDTQKKKYEIFLQTELTGAELQKRLFYINQQSRSVMEEQGYNILYLALSFLKYTQEPDNMMRLAPLILIPVELERKRVKGNFKLKWTGEDIISNISLQAKLKEDGIDLPDFDMPRTKDGILDYIKLIKKAISSEKNWEILGKTYLGFFSFTKFVMYKDLELESWPEDFPLEKNPIMKAIFDPPLEEGVSGFKEQDVDLQLSAKEVHHVLDADSSQIAVIEDVKHGRDMVVEGPPGTGKSQTIVNLIAELIVRGKTVLFVSEKMAALEVVKGRLDNIGLGEFCLELHSRKSNKKDVLNKLESTLRSSEYLNISIEEELVKIDELKSELNEYVHILHEPYGNIHWTPFQIFGLKEKSIHHFEDSQRKMPRFKIDNPEMCTLTEWQESNSKLKELTDLYKLVRPIQNNPWNITHPDPVLPAEEEEIELMLENSMKRLDDLEKDIARLSKISGVTVPENLEELEHLIHAVKIITSFPSLERELILNQQWDYEKINVQKIIKSLEEFNSHKEDLKQFKKDVLDQNITTLLLEFKRLKEKILKFLSSDFKRLKKEISALYIKKAPDDDDQIIRDLENIIRCQKLRERIRAEDERGNALFGSHWKGEKSQVQNLKSISEWILKFRKALAEGRITKKVLIILDSSQQEQIKDINSRIYQEFEELLILKNRLNRFLNFEINSSLGKMFLSSSIIHLKEQLKSLKMGIGQLQNWSRYTASRKENLNTIARSMVYLVDNDGIDADDAIPCLEGNFCDALIKSIFLTSPVLSRFVSNLQESKIKEFIELDQRIIRLNRVRISSKLHDSRPSLDNNASPLSELGILKSEFARKRGHMPIRKLLSVSGGLIQKIKPCFMMSPLSIAQYFDPHSVRNLQFDYVIFDEASQVKPEDALGALLRGKHAVIMGDTRQLPPTTFFDIMLDFDSEDYDISVISDMESILHLCKRSFPSKMLRWHYRSRHESLIAVSNQEFYDNNLLIYPSPSHDTEELGLKFIHLPDTVYDRGKSATNRSEAKEVIKYAFDHYKKYGDQKSLGIGTFNIRQQQALLEELELQLKLNPQMEKFFNRDLDEHFFVKNLETIQGDERDVIVVSVGYGFDEEGRLSHNFGPLNQDGGERRLNVLVTRAREKCIVFANFRGRDLDIKNTAPFGLRALKVFLEYAESHNLHYADKPYLDIETPFEDSVFDFLTENGYKVDRQVGCAGFRIDMAVVDPDYPGRYILGIQGDGVMYHSSPVARDRDRLRQQILEGLGWKFYRLWSTDWYRNRAEIQKALLNHIKELENEERSKKDVIPPVVEELEVDTVPIEIVEEIEDAEVVAEVEEIIPYELAQLDFEIKGEIHNRPVGEITQAIVRVVEVESPVHYNEVVRRIRTYWGLKRAGSRVQNIIREAVNLGLLDGQIYEKNDFLFLKNGEIKIRRRSVNPPANIDLISDDEIQEAIKNVIKTQYATANEELIKQVSRLFGIKITRGKTTSRIQSVIDYMKKVGEIQERQDGMLDVAKN